MTSERQRFTITDLESCEVCLHLVANGEFNDGTDAAERASAGMERILGEDQRYLVPGNEDLGYSVHPCESCGDDHHGDRYRLHLMVPVEGDVDPEPEPVADEAPADELDVEALTARTMSCTAGAGGVRGCSAGELEWLLDQLEAAESRAQEAESALEEMQAEHSDCTPAPDQLRLSLADLEDTLAQSRARGWSGMDRARAAAAHHREYAASA